jgi:GNAT superfamily N-acetyltransferase
VFGSPIREATEQDYPTFLKLWITYLESQLSFGGDILPTPKTISFFTVVFNAYVTGERRGVVLLAGPDWGVSLWGEDMGDPPVDTRYAPLARGWGTYITPEHRREGLGNQIREYGSRRMRDMGFKHIAGTILTTNEVSTQSLKKYETSTLMMLHIKALEDC